MTLARERLLWALFAASALVTAWTESEIIWLFLASGLLAMWAKAPPSWVKASSALGMLPLPLWSRKPRFLRTRSLLRNQHESLAKRKTHHPSWTR